MNEDKFTGKAEVYSSHRPEYPPGLYACLFSEVGFKAGDAVADIGAGTGIFSKPLVKCGCKVFAVEPNPDMRRIMVRDSDRNPDFVVVDGTAESSALPAGSVNWVTAAQAFHWFNPSRFSVECGRILVPGGMAVLAYNHRVADDPVTRDTYEVNKRHCPNFLGFSGGMPNRAESTLGVFFKGGGFSTREFRHERYLDRDGFIGRALSSSYAPSPGHASYAGYIEELGGVFDKHSRNGILCGRLVCRIYWGEVQAASPDGGAGPKGNRVV